MKTLAKFLKYLLLLFVVLVAVLMIYLKFVLPSVGEPEDLKVEMTGENIARGKYLANHVMVCIDCHSTRDWTRFAGPPIAGTDGKGGETFDQKLGFPGKYVASNITPYNLKDWTDGEILRAITGGVSKDGRALFSIMPYHHYGKLDKRDIEAVIAYIRSLKPIVNNPDKSGSDFPMNFIINTLPGKANFSSMPSRSNSIEYGKYLVTAAACMDCHTRQEKGKFTGELFAGGFDFRFADGSVVRSANLTPDQTTGIGNWSKNQFISRFKMYVDSSYTSPVVKPGEFQTTMPWTMYGGMDTLDLAAIYDYLHSLKPVKNSVEKFTPPSH